MQLLSTTQKNDVLATMIDRLAHHRDAIIAANAQDLAAFDRDDQAMYDRLVVDTTKVDGMIQAVREVMAQPDPVGQVISEQHLDNGLAIYNKTAPFGTIMIIYESRPDVTIEAAVLAFKANNKILLKGGKEARNSNRILERCWHEALAAHGLSTDWIQLLNLSRTETQAFLKQPPQPIDLIVPRGGERLIDFVKTHATCAVLVSGRGNNFLYLHPEADWNKALSVILNAKTHKISACNALDKILVDKYLPDLDQRLEALYQALQAAGVQVLVSESAATWLPDAEVIQDEAVWYEEFLAMRIVIGLTDDLHAAIAHINQYAGGHSTAILTEDAAAARTFMEQVDSAAVYQNASTRFTDGGQMGVGAELAISTDKLHHRGPLGLKQLVTNKYYVFGDGHIRQ